MIEDLSELRIEFAYGAILVKHKCGPYSYLSWEVGTNGQPNHKCTSCRKNLSTELSFSLNLLNFKR
jgi:hypothetical protein